MRSTPALDARAGLEKLATYPFHVASWVERDRYPVSVAVEATIDPVARTASFAPPAGLAVPIDREVSLTGSHIRPQPGYGYDERRHVTVWGRVSPGIRPDTMDRILTLVGRSAWGWDEAEVPFFEYSERSRAAVPPVLRRALGRARDAGQAAAVVRLPDPARDPPAVPDRHDRPGRCWASSSPRRHGSFDLVAAALTVDRRGFVQLGLNVANDVFDTVQGADDANVTPTQFSGGSRVIQYGLVSLRQMATLATAVLRRWRA